MSVLESIVMTMELPEAQEPTPTTPTKYQKLFLMTDLKLLSAAVSALMIIPIRI